MDLWAKPPRLKFVGYSRVVVVGRGGGGVEFLGSEITRTSDKIKKRVFHNRCLVQ